MWELAKGRLRGEVRGGGEERRGAERKKGREARGNCAIRARGTPSNAFVGIPVVLVCKCSSTTGLTVAAAVSQ